MPVFILGAGLFLLSGGGGGCPYSSKLGKGEQLRLKQLGFRNIQKYECTEDMFANCTCCY